MKRGLAVVAALLLSCACGEPASAVKAPVPTTTATPKAGVSAPRAPAPDSLALEIAEMLGQVAKARSLAPKTAVRGERLDRDAVIQLIMAKTEKELPEGVLEAQGEMLRGFGLIEPDYAFVDGIYELIQQNLAGFYDQHVDKMFILDDLPKAAIAETLAHELVHALQDQHFDLAPLLEYRPGDSDRVTAGHALAEGDAMSAMFDLSMGDARKMTVTKLRLAMVASVAFSPTGNRTPRVLQASLIAPYIDGFRFVQELRERGGWKAVDDAYKNLPVSTEQLLHVDKYLAQEKPLTVAEPALPTGFVRQDHDVLGEQGLRMVFEQWTTNETAATAAEGWGGDRFSVGKRPHPDGGYEWAAAWLIRFDSADHAREAAAVMRAKHGPGCVARTDLGPLAWKHRGADLAIVVGPFRKAEDGSLTSGATCPAASSWLTGALGSP